MNSPAYEQAKERYVELKDELFGNLKIKFPEYKKNRRDKIIIDGMDLVLKQVLESIDIIHNRCIFFKTRKIGDIDIATRVLQTGYEELQLINDKINNGLSYENAKIELDFHVVHFFKNSNKLTKEWHNEQKSISSPRKPYSMEILEQNTRKKSANINPTSH